MSNEHLLYSVGNNKATGFISPEATLIYLTNTNTGSAIFSVEDLARIIVAHQRRARIARSDAKK